MTEEKNAYALYRLPDSDTYTEIVQETGSPETFFSCCGLDGRSGFVLAPFAVSGDLPILLIHPDRIISGKVDALPFLPDEAIPATQVINTGRDSYLSDFKAFHTRLVSGEFGKVVLSRCAVYDMQEPVSPRVLFARACRFFPHMFVALVHTGCSGTWLAATPEILLGGSGKSWHTVALAGTMPLECGRKAAGEAPPPFRPKGSNGSIVPEICRAGDAGSFFWNHKNIEEQRYVSSYIKECVSRFAEGFREEGPRTVRAGNVVHLRSDFTFTISPDVGIGRLLGELHPTPAVCGMPKQEAFDFINAHEASPRKYYSGFMGPVDISDSTHLYVSLRCMHINGCRCRLYAGGGLLPASCAEEELMETEAKMESMRKCLAIKRI